MKGKQLLIGIALIGGFSGLIYYAYTHRNVRKEKTKTTDLPTALQLLAQKVTDAGYTVTNSPLSHPGSKFISFPVPSGDHTVRVLVNDKNIITITVDPLTPPYVMEFKDGHFYHGNKVIDDNTDMLAGILQVIENQDYK